MTPMTIGTIFIRYISPVWTTHPCDREMNIDPFEGMTADMIMRGAQTWHCENRRQCPNEAKCWNAHSKAAYRRYPYKFNKEIGKWELRYMPFPCKAYKCPHGKNCKHAHSCAEIRFHPMIFRMQECKNEREPGQWCGRPFCTFYHNEEERRTGLDDICFDDTEVALPLVTQRNLS